MGFRLDWRIGLSWWIVLPVLAACSSVSAPRLPSAQGEVKVREVAVPDSDRCGHAANVEYIQALAYPENTMPAIRLDLDAGPTTVVEGEGTTTCKGHPTVLPFHLDYVFNFGRHDGRPHVEAIDRKSPRVPRYEFRAAAADGQTTRPIRRDNGCTCSHLPNQP